MNEEAEARGEKILYKESVSYGIWFYVFMYPLIALYAFLGVVMLIKGDPASIAIYGGLFLALLALYINFRRLNFEITDDEVRFGFGIIQKRFALGGIVSCEPYTLTFKNYLGYGIRYGRDGTTAYNTRNGPGVKIVVEGAKRPYVISISGVEDVCKIIDSRRKK